MTMTETKTDVRLMTADELLRLYSKGVRGELIRGELYKTMPAGIEHGEIVMKLGAELIAFVKARRSGRIAGSDSGVLLEQDPDTVREPDIAFFSESKIPAGTRVRGYAEVVPDLVVEVVSPNNSTREINDKALMWISHGVRLVWVVYPDSRTIALYTHDGPVTVLTDTDALNGQEVLPGFTCNVADIFD